MSTNTKAVVSADRRIYGDDKFYSDMPSVFMFIFFVYAGVVQLNDPDRLLWISLYTLAASASLSRYLLGKVCALTNRLNFLSGVSAVAVFVYLGLFELTEHEQWLDVALEVGREQGGAAIVIGWSAFQIVRSQARLHIWGKFLFALSVTACSFLAPIVIAGKKTPLHCTGIGWSFSRKQI
eukprot:TRINITY_DN153803_c0_g1_i1.p1 TRINITY_DN153803_c0_g1~~TRINITY_DN153803_c0_g1_i1.p1  ORF type:complete len:180 (+),score=9.94 TRINITY_DN153803_c0_g1_i1:75-614(+)